MKNLSNASPDASGLQSTFRAIWTKEFAKMFLVSTIITFSTQFQATTFPIYVQALGGGLAVAGLMTSVYMGTSAFCKPFVGKLLARYPRKPLFIVAGILFSCMMFSHGFIVAIPMLMLMRVINAPMYSICNTSATTITTDILPKDCLVEGLGYYNLAQTLSYALGPSIALYLINDYSYRALFTACAVFGLVAVLIGSTVKYQDPIVEVRKEHRQAVTNVRLPNASTKNQAIFKKEFVAPSLMLFLVLLGTSGIVTFLPTWAKNAGVENIGLFFTVQAVALALSRMFVGKVSKKIGAMATITGSIVLIVICLFGIGWCTQLSPLLLLSLLYGFGFGSIVPTLHSIAILYSDESNRGMANSMIQMATDGGICISSFMLGIVADAIGIHNVFFVAGVLPVLSLVIFLFGLQKQIRQLGI